MITAPFNFVPLSEKVFFPSWADEVSHDIPFEDGESGSIDITITAKSPIFIRDHENPEQFCNYNGEYYIPSSSVKGMVRSVLEIMSFGKIPIDKKTHSKITSVRDMTNRKELVGTADGCGFLKQDNNHWFIEDYGKPRTIEYNNQTKKTIGEINCNFDTAEEKFPQKDTLYIQISVKNDMKDLYDRKNKFLGKKRVATLFNGGNNAYLIFTGGIENKKNEFVFTDTDRVKNIILNDNVVDKFKKVYFESDSVDGNFWKNNYNPNIGIPIFYKKDKNKVTDIGLTQLFKLAYNHTVDDATKQILETTTRKDKKYIKLDLAETIFGTIQDELVKDKKDKKVKKESFALKGRVQFSHFRCNSTPEPFNDVYTVLGSPNPSFYPEYIKQNCKDDGKVQNDKYNTLMDNTAKIAGWKRYPLRHGRPQFTKAEEGTDSATKFTPIGNYNRDNFNEFTFSGKVRFHNLKKVEIGALISALTFHNNQENFYHNIGMAKSLGFGKIRIDIDTKPYQEHLVEYEMIMNKELNRDWIETEQIKELFVMAYKNLNINNKLKYLKLDPENRIDEFSDAKNEKLNKNYVGRDCLPKVSKLFDMQDNYPKTLLTDEVLKRIKDIEEKKELDITSINEWKRIISNRKHLTKERIEQFIKKYPNSSKKEEAEKELEVLTASKIKTTNQALNFSKAKDGKGIERVIKSIQNPSDEDKDKLEEAIKMVYPNLNAKKKQFLRSSKLMVKWLGQDRFEELIK